MLKFLMRISILLALLFPGEAGERKRPEGDPIVVSPEALAELPPAPANKGRMFVALHSTLVGQGGMKRLNFSGALSIHNTSSRNPLLIEKIDYRDGAGQMVESYVTKPLALQPFASMQVLIAQDDVRGGTGASFIVDWSTADSAEEPVVEVTATAGTQSFSFLSQGRKLPRN